MFETAKKRSNILLKRNNLPPKGQNYLKLVVSILANQIHGCSSSQVFHFLAEPFIFIYLFSRVFNHWVPESHSFSHFWTSYVFYVLYAIKKTLCRWIELLNNPLSCLLCEFMLRFFATNWPTGSFQFLFPTLSECNQKRDERTSRIFLVV